MLIETKLHLPKSRAALVTRVRLCKRLDEGLHGKLTLVTAPAGYGKTTLVSEWASSKQMPVAWVSLDPEDRGANRLWRYTLAGLKKVLPEFDDRSVLRFSAGAHSGNFIAAFLNQLHRLSEPIVLVWDDFHHVDEPAFVHEVDYFLEHLPSHVHIYMLSRRVPSLSLAKMRTAYILNEIKMEELRFSISEIEDFFRQQRIPALLPHEMHVLLKQTEGWVAGLQLAALYLKEEPLRSFSDVGKLGELRNVSDYFFEEVFRHQTPDMQSFLLRTSLLERMNVELCQIITGLNNCQAYLHQLEQMNCFLIPLDERREWFRYHQLFQDFLRVKSKEKLLERSEAHHQQVGIWLEAHTYWEEAISHYIAGEHFKEAIRLLAKQMPLLIRTELGALRHWLAQIPHDALVNHPTLLMSDIFSLFLLGDIPAAQKKLRMIEQWNKKQLEPVRGGFMMLQLLGLFFAKDFEAAIRYSSQYVRAYPEGGSMASLMASLGTEGDFDVTDSSLLETVKNVQEREHITFRLLEIWSQSSDYYLYTEFNLGYGDVLYELNQLDEAILYWNKARRLGEQNQNRLIITVSALKIAQGYAAQGKQTMAEEMLTELDKQLDRRHYPRLARFFDVYEANLRLQWGETEKAAQLVEHHHLQVTDEIPHTMHLEYVVFACLLAERGLSGEALALLRRLTNVAHRSERMSEAISLLARQSCILFDEGKVVESMDALEEALALAESGGYVRSVLDLGKSFIVVLQTYLEARQKRHRRPKINVSMPYVKRILKLDRCSGEQNNALDAPRNHEVRLTEKEMIVLQCMAKELSNKEMAVHLGVSINTVKTHIHHIYGKLLVNNRMAAIEQAKRLDILV